MSAGSARDSEDGSVIELEATHITNHFGPYNRLVCELYPGILVVDGYGAYTAVTYGGYVDRLPAGQGRAFPVRERTAERAAELYDRLMRQAESGYLASWPVPEWIAANK